MQGLKQALMNTKLSKKNFANEAPESVKHLKQAVLSLKATAQTKSDNTIVIKTNIFEVPREVWRSGFNAFQFDQ